MKQLYFYYRGEDPSVIEKALPLVMQKNPHFVVDLDQGEHELASTRRAFFQEEERVRQELGAGRICYFLLHQRQPAHLAPGQDHELREARRVAERDLFFSLLDEVEPSKRMELLQHTRVIWSVSRGEEAGDPLAGSSSSPPVGEEEEPVAECAAEGAEERRPRTPEERERERVVRLVHEDLVERRRMRSLGGGGDRREELARELSDEHAYLQKVYGAFSVFFERLLRDRQYDLVRLYREVLTHVLRQMPREFREKETTLRARIKATAASSATLRGALARFAGTYYDKKLPRRGVALEELDETALDVIRMLNAFYKHEASRKRQAVEEAWSRVEMASQKALDAGAALDASYASLAKTRQSLQDAYNRMTKIAKESRALDVELERVSIAKAGARDFVGSVMKQKLNQTELEKVAEIKRNIAECEVEYRLSKKEIAGRKRELERAEQAVERAGEALESAENAVKVEERRARDTALEKRRETGVGELFVQMTIRFFPYYLLDEEEEESQYRSPSGLIDRLVDEGSLPAFLYRSFIGFLPGDTRYDYDWRLKPPRDWRQELDQFDKCLVLYLCKPGQAGEMTTRMVEMLRRLYGHFTFMNTMFTLYEGRDAAPMKEIPANIELAFTEQRSLTETLMAFRLYKRLWKETASYREGGKGKAMESAMEALQEAKRAREETMTRRV